MPTRQDQLQLLRETSSPATTKRERCCPAEVEVRACNGLHNAYGFAAFAVSSPLVLSLQYQISAAGFPPSQLEDLTPNANGFPGTAAAKAIAIANVTTTKTVK